MLLLGDGAPEWPRIAACCCCEAGRKRGKLISSCAMCRYHDVYNVYVCSWMLNSERALNSSIYLFIFLVSLGLGLSLSHSLFPDFIQCFFVVDGQSVRLLRTEPMLNLPSTDYVAVVVVDSLLYSYLSRCTKLSVSIRKNEERAMQISACSSSYFKNLLHCCVCRRSRRFVRFVIFFFSHPLIPIEPFFLHAVCCHHFFSTRFCVCRYTVVFCFHLVIYNFVNLMLSRLRVPSSHSTQHTHTQPQSFEHQQRTPSAAAAAELSILVLNAASAFCDTHTHAQTKLKRK